MIIIDKDPTEVIPEIKPTDCIISYSQDDWSVRYVSYNVLEHDYYKFRGISNISGYMQTWQDACGNTLMDLICDEYNRFKTFNRLETTEMSVVYLVIRSQKDLQEANDAGYRIPRGLIEEILVNFPGLC